MSTWIVDTDSAKGSGEKQVGKATVSGHRRAFVRFAAVLAALAFVLLSTSVTSPPAGHAAFLREASDEPKVTICHRPPGNPTKLEVIRVAQSDVADHLAHGDPIGVNVLYVDASAEFPGSGRSESPFRRVTDAVNLARCIRQAEGDYDSADAPLEIQVEAGEYVGAYTRNVLAKDETLEELPIILNVPNLILRGSTILELDDDGRPTWEVDGSGTIITGA